MAISFSHRWGQIVGAVIEAMIRDLLQKTADENKLYLDYKRARRARSGKKVSWKDLYSNTHDLDYVFERGGTEAVRGQPVAFIESAWRRYTKHSRNKAQEIQGAIIPLADTYSDLHPFLGIILAGVFTKGSLDQLRSRGFTLVYFPYESVLRAFSAAGIDASFDEQTSEKEFRKKIRQWRMSLPGGTEKIKKKLLETEKRQVLGFLEKLRESLLRKVVSVTVSILHGQPKENPSVNEAIKYIKSYRKLEDRPHMVQKYEINIRYSNGDTIHAVFHSQGETIAFLKSFV